MRGRLGTAYAPSFLEAAKLVTWIHTAQLGGLRTSLNTDVLRTYHLLPSSYLSFILEGGKAP